MKLGPGLMYVVCHTLKLDSCQILASHVSGIMSRVHFSVLVIKGRIICV